MPRPDGPARRITGLPQFVTVRGGGYFFLPGLRALRYIAGAPSTRPIRGVGRTDADASASGTRCC